MKTSKNHKITKYGQKLIAPFRIEVFDSRNTSFNDPQIFSNESEAKLYTKMKSVPFKAIVRDSAGNWMEYEKGIVTSWSVSLGTDKVPE